MSWTDRKKLFKKYAGRLEFKLSTYSFANVFLWKNFFEFDFKIIDDYLCIFARYDAGTFLYLPPIGKKLTKSVVDQCFEYLGKHNSRRGVGRIENVAEDQLTSFSSDQFDIYKKGYEYCYLKDDQINARGNTFKSKRSDYNYFVKGYQSQFVPFEKGMLTDCLSLYESWTKKRSALNKDVIYNQMLEDNRKVHELALKNDEFLNLIGRVVFVDKKIAAYTFGYPLSRDTFCVLFEITDLNYKGLPAYIFREFCKDASLRKYRFINVMDDFELQNIQKTKMSFKPSVMFPAYVVTPKG